MSNKAQESATPRMLRQGDPLAGDPGFSDKQRMAMRRATLAEIPDSVTPHWRQLAPVLSTATLLAVALGVAWWPTAIEHSSAPPAIEEGVTTADSEERRIQFETSGGTLVVWILDPDFPS